jgi:hypothetical protein
MKSSSYVEISLKYDRMFNFRIFFIILYNYHFVLYGLSKILLTNVQTDCNDLQPKEGGYFESNVNFLGTIFTSGRLLSRGSIFNPGRIKSIVLSMYLSLD